MDLSKLENLELIHDQRFIDASPQELMSLEYRFDNGDVMKPQVKDGTVVGFTATDGTGNRLPVIHVKIAGDTSERTICLYCNWPSNN